jgi:hypothetical protein
MGMSEINNIQESNASQKELTKLTHDVQFTYQAIRNLPSHPTDSVHF